MPSAGAWVVHAKSSGLRGKRACGAPGGTSTGGLKPLCGLSLPPQEQGARSGEGAPVVGTSSAVQGHRVPPASFLGCPEGARLYLWISRCPTPAAPQGWSEPLIHPEAPAVQSHLTPQRPALPRVGSSESGVMKATRENHPEAPFPALAQVPEVARLLISLTVG